MILQDTQRALLVALLAVLAGCASPPASVAPGAAPPPSAAPPALPPSAAFQLDADTSAGSVRSDFPVLTTRSGERSELKCPVNGGGPVLKLRTSAGSIRVKKS